MWHAASREGRGSGGGAGGGGEGKCGTGGGGALTNGYAGGVRWAQRRGWKGWRSILLSGVVRSWTMLGCTSKKRGLRSSVWMSPTWIDGCERSTSPMCLQTSPRTTRRGLMSSVQIVRNLLESHRSLPTRERDLTIPKNTGPCFVPGGVRTPLDFQCTPNSPLVRGTLDI